MRWLAVVALLSLLACHDDTDSCELPAVCYSISLGPGTGTCDPEATAALAESVLETFSTENEVCGPHVISMDTASEPCIADYTVEADLTKDGPQSGSLTIQGNCGEFGSDCDYSYDLAFAETACGS